MEDILGLKMELQSLRIVRMIKCAGHSKIRLYGSPYYAINELCCGEKTKFSTFSIVKYFKCVIKTFKKWKKKKTD